MAVGRAKGRAPILQCNAIMPSEIPKLLLCWSCAGKGLVVLGTVCVVCDGVGAVPRFRVTLPVLRIAADDPDGWSHRRILVLWVHRDEERDETFVHGLNENGDSVMFAIEPSQLARASAVNLEEVGSWL